MNTVKIDKYFRGMVAHRGLSAIETENTIPAFIAAANRSYFGIECDVHASKDGKIIVTHDDTLLRLGMLNLYIPSFKYDEIRKFTLIDRKTGNLSEYISIPLLEDYLMICKNYQKHAFIELKQNMTNEHIDKVIQLVFDHHYHDHVSIITFQEKYITYIKKRYPQIDLYLLTDELNEHVIEFCEKYVVHLDIRYDLIDEATIKRLHLIGLKVAVWTVDDKDIAERLIKLGVDYITSNILE
jgi:glycerophosphoryl diester phosphodiesterase